MVDQEQSLNAVSQLTGLVDGMTGFVRSIGGFVLFIDRTLKAIMEAADHADREHNRAELLQAYRRRHQWKRSDIPRLESLGVNAAARSRMRRLPSRRGRPSVRPHISLAQLILVKANALGTVFDPNITPSSRRRALKNSPWWKHYAEALYRGEREEARATGVPGPADHAERVVGRALGISPSSLRSICRPIRRMRDRHEPCANFPMMTLADYEGWMLTGELASGRGRTNQD